MRFPAVDLLPGDRYIHRDADDVAHVVTIVEKIGFNEDRFGNRLVNFVGKAEDERTGRVTFGERASVDAVL